MKLSNLFGTVKICESTNTNTNIQRSSDDIEKRIYLLDRKPELFNNGMIPSNFFLEKDWVERISLESCALTSLDNMPARIEDCLFLAHNKLTNLNGCPLEIDRHFYVEDNPLTSLDGFPKHVGGAAIFNVDDLSNFNVTGYIPKVTKNIVLWFDMDIKDKHINITKLLTWCDKIYVMRSGQETDLPADFRLVNKLLQQCLTEANVRKRIMILTESLIKNGFENLTGDA